MGLKQMNNQRHIKRSFASDFSRDAREGNLIDKRLESKLNVLTQICEHDSYCHKLKTMPNTHCSEDYMKICGKVKSFYDKYKEAGNQLGVGS